MKKMILLVSFAMCACTSIPPVQYQSAAPIQTLIIDPNVQAMSEARLF